MVSFYGVTCFHNAGVSWAFTAADMGDYLQQAPLPKVTLSYFSLQCLRSHMQKPTSRNGHDGVRHTLEILSLQYKLSLRVCWYECHLHVPLLVAVAIFA